jgi:3-isopropylmalate dehydratase small subunit
MHGKPPQDPHDPVNGKTWPVHEISDEIRTDRVIPSQYTSSENTRRDESKDNVMCV